MSCLLSATDDRLSIIIAAPGGLLLTRHAVRAMPCGEVRARMDARGVRHVHVGRLYRGGCVLGGDGLVGWLDVSVCVHGKRSRVFWKRTRLTHMSSHCVHELS